ncbi:MAG: archaetidylserine decarboxylase [Gammaproteobacteria bacterium]
MLRFFYYLLTLPQYLLPQHVLTGLVYRLTRIELRWFKNLLINIFIILFKVNMQEAEKPFADNYASFNDFFTRRLKEGARQRSNASDKVMSPVDGSISQLGNIDELEVFQAKGKSYSVEQLLAGDKDLCEKFRHGHFATLYLSPRDYHRIHMPISGKLVKTVYVPGKLFAVNNAAVSTVTGLFARNERFIAIFDTPHGSMALVMVGALFVGSMETVWAGQITPATERVLAVNTYEDNDISLEQGEEMGRFNMGSTVILLFERDRIDWLESLHADSKIQVGQLLADKQ